jgi:tRNA-specific 2-thiouridylase
LIAVAMSGGVDSSAAAVVLKEQGQEIVGLSMQLWNQRRSLTNEVVDTEAGIRRSGRCCSPDDLWDARRVATHIGFPFYVLNLEDEFEQTVVAPFVDTYLRGETPSPCVLCNNFVKFHHLVDKAEQIGADRVATGHYARVRFDNERGRWLLLRGRDQRKDQSYFLFGLTQTQLSKTVFPLGELKKDEVREIARRAGLPTYNKPESQEICFVPEGGYAEFVEKYAQSAKPSEGDISAGGEIVNLEGDVVGMHRGVHNFTVGQRKGLVAAGRPQYVVRIEPEQSLVVIGDDQDTAGQTFRVRDTNWIAIEGAGRDPIHCDIQIRNRFEPRPGSVRIENGETIVRFEKPQRAITPGQAAVFYWDDVVIGGGWITR